MSFDGFIIIVRRIIELIRNHNNKNHSMRTQKSQQHTAISIINGFHIRKYKRLVWTWRKAVNQSRTEREWGSECYSQATEKRHNKTTKWCVVPLLVHIFLILLASFYFHFKFTSGIHLKTSLFNASFSACLFLHSFNTTTMMMMMINDIKFVTQHKN